MPKTPPKPKFDEVDREKVISDIEEHFGITLSRVGNRRKVLTDTSGKLYWIFGGYDRWHGFPSEMLAEAQSSPGDGVLVVATRRRTSIDIFVGPLQPLIDNSRRLWRTNDYQFNVSARGTTMSVDEISALSLKKIGPSHEVGIAMGAKAKELYALFAKMTPEECEQMLENLRAEKVPETFKVE